MAAGYSELARNAMLNSLNAIIGTGGKMRIYSGARPTNVDTALAGNTVLAEMALSSAALAAAAVGVAMANTITPDTSADNTGTAVWASILTNGNVRVVDFNVAVGGTDLDVNTVDFVATALVTVSPFGLGLTP